MDWDDIVYLALLFFSIGFGYFYRTIYDVESKKKIGTAIGLVMTLIVSGLHIIHPLICTLINACIILYTPKRICHIVSFIYTFGHLVFFRTTEYFGIPFPPAHTNLIQMMLTLKLVGLAFEVNSAYLAKRKTEDNVSAEDVEKLNYIQINPSFMDIWHYAFNYIGVLTGPYYKYRTFYDYFYLPFGKHVDYKRATFDKIKWIPLFAIIFLILTGIWPISYINNEEFYNDRSWLYRLWYVIPTFAWFRMRIYIGLTLSECVCTMTGLGAYPDFTEPKPGEGPTKEFIKLQKIIKNDKELQKLEYNFITIYNINPYGSDFCVTFREAMKHWNICIQYWLAVNIYKRFPSKKFRTFATTFVSAAWHGVYLGYYYTILSVPFYLAVEDQYMKMFRSKATGFNAVIMDWIVWAFKMAGFSYFGFAFHLLTMDKVLRYYNSVYHSGEMILLILYLIAIYIKSKRSPKDNSDKKSR